MRLIDADALKESLSGELYDEKDIRDDDEDKLWMLGNNSGIREAKRLADKAPTIDPVEHGHWIPIDGMSGKCSACDEESDYPLMCCEGTPSTRYEPYPHCPWCGAIMDQVVSE